MNGGPWGMRTQLYSHEGQASMHAYAVKLRVHVHARQFTTWAAWFPFPPFSWAAKPQRLGTAALDNYLQMEYF